MSLTTALASLRTAIEATGLHATEETDNSRLLDMSRGEFDAAYLVRVESAVTLYRELKRSPEAYRCRIAVEIGTTHDHNESFADCQIRAGDRSTAVIAALIAARHTDVINIYSDGTSTAEVADRQHVTTHRFQLIFRG